MKYIKIIALLLSIFSLEKYCYTDWNADITRYYATPYNSDSYIDLNKDISMRSYTNNTIQPFPAPGTIKENSLQNYPFPNRNQRKELYIQPSDGSMTNGIYEINSKTAKTALHEYKDVITVDGTYQAPQLTPRGTYIDEKGTELVSIGSVKIPAEDASPSDINTYYLFGVIVPTTKSSSTLQKNTPLQDYNSTNE